MDEQPPAPEGSDIGPPTTPSPQTSAPQRSLLDAAIDQMLKENPDHNDSTYSSESREQMDLARTLHPHIECASGDTLIIVNFPHGYASCRWEDVRQYLTCIQTPLFGIGIVVSGPQGLQ